MKRKPMTWAQCWYKAHKEAGLCPACARPARPGKVVCERCAEAQRRSARKARNTETHAARRKQIREAKKAAGICTRCSKPAEPGHTTCSSCSAYMRRFQMGIYNRRRRRSECTKCGTATVKGTLCEACKPVRRAVQREHYRRNKAAKTTEAQNDG